MSKTLTITIEIVSIVSGLAALIFSGWSLHLSKIAYVRSSRPFVWAINYSIPVNGNLTPQPNVVLFKVMNAPAKILSSIMEIRRKGELVISTRQEKSVRFPFDQGLWYSYLSPNDSAKVFDSHDADELTRMVTIEYTALDRNEVYTFHLEQVFVPAEKGWIDTLTEAD